MACSISFSNFSDCCSYLNISGAEETFTDGVLPFCSYLNYGYNYTEFCARPCVFLRYSCIIKPTATSIYGILNSISEMLGFILILTVIYLRRRMAMKQARAGDGGGQTRTAVLLPIHFIYFVVVSVYVLLWTAYNFFVEHGASFGVPLLALLFYILQLLIFFPVFYMTQRGWGGRALRNALKISPVVSLLTLVGGIPGLLLFENSHKANYYFGFTGFPVFLVVYHSVTLIIVASISCIPLLWRIKISRDENMYKSQAMMPSSMREGLTPKEARNKRHNRLLEFIFRHTHPRRTAVYRLTVYISILSVPWLIGAVLLMLSVDAGSCIWESTLTLFQMTFAPLLLWVLQGETNFFRSVAVGPMSVMKLAGTDLAQRQSAKSTGGASTGRTLTTVSESEGGGVVSSSYVVDVSELKVDEEIGRGAAGEVYSGWLRGYPIAAKKLYCEIFDETTMIESMREAATLSHLKHPNVISFEGVSFQPPYLYVITELCEKGNLQEVLQKEGASLSPRRLIEMAMCIARGMAYLHERKPPVLHRDMKTPNLLVNSDYVVKVCDFDISMLEGEDSSAANTPGTIRWSAPEVLKKEPYTFKSDVYSFGVVLWEMFATASSGIYELPFTEVSRGGFDGYIEDAVISKYRPALPDECPKSIGNLITACWAHNANDRPDFKSVLNKMEEALQLL